MFRPRRLFPCFTRVREESAAVMAACVAAFVQTGAGRVPAGWESRDWREAALGSMYSTASEHNEHDAPHKMTQADTAKKGKGLNSKL